MRLLKEPIKVKGVKKGRKINHTPLPTPKEKKRIRMSLNQFKSSRRK